MPTVQRTLSRRNALKTLSAIGGAVALSGLPSGWETPLVEVGTLPAHAQISGIGIAKIEDSLLVSWPDEEGVYEWHFLISHNVPAGIAVDGDGYVKLESHYDYDSGALWDADATIVQGDEYRGRISGCFDFEYGRAPQLTIRIWLIDQNGEPTNRLTYVYSNLY